ncbi:MAG TPA: choice-of-anchor D domain-containing protein, partial [Candidatus Acidoferrum sp.]
SITFTPASAGSLTANLQVADNAPGTPQTLVLNGTGSPALPAMTLSPAVPSFPTTTQGTSSPTQTLTVTNSGNAPLTISSVSLGGSNASDFSLINNCTASVAVASNCTVSLTFNPIAPGLRTADLLISDNVPSSPQTVSLSATANPAFSVAAASGSSTAASVSAGQTAQYQLQLTPGTGFSGAVSLVCSGAPLAAVCQLPGSVSLTGGAPTTFTVSVTTSGPALLPLPTPLHVPPVSRVPLLAPVLLVLLLSFFLWFRRSCRWPDCATARNRLALCAALFAAIFCITFSLAGCGGGSAAVTPPPPVVTPSGTSTLTIAPSANSSTGQPLQLQPIQLTLTVN